MAKDKTIILVAKDGRPSMKGVFTKMISNTDLFVRRRVTSRKTGRVRQWFRKYINANVDVLTKIKIEAVDFTDKIIIRWGNRIEADLNNSIVYNKAEAIAKGSDKKLTRQIFVEKGISTPRAVNPQSLDINYPVIARPRTHAKGRNFITLNNLQDFQRHYNNNNGNWYYSEFVDKVKEYRVHCAHGRILNYLEKPNPGDGQIAWNRAINGEAFTNVNWDSYDSKIALECLKAVEALGLDFGGVDVIVNANGTPYILEVNTSPTLNSSEYSMTRYAKYFDWLAKSPTRREHFELKEFKKPSNYAWHEYHFEDRNPNQD